MRSRAVPKPQLPDERPRLPRDVYRDLKGAVAAGELDDAASALSASGEALTAGDTARALELLTWAKSVAPRSGAVREALGVALYRSGSFESARSELGAYHRITGRSDQGHLLADCARALGRPELVERHVTELLDGQAEPARRAEAVIVLAAARTDADDPEGGLAALDRVRVSDAPDEAAARWWYVRGDVLERLGRTDDAVAAFESAQSLDADGLDVSERVATLRQ